MNQTTTATPVIQVYTSNIERNPKQPRQWFDNEELEQLTVSVREHGIIQPLIVAPSSKPDVYILIAGERRLLAARRANLETVPVVVRQVIDEQEMLILALVENVERAEMTPVEEGDAYLLLRGQGMSNAKIARKVGLTDVHVGNCIFCAELPQQTRELMNTDQLFISNQFVSIMHDIALISPKACDETAQRIADTQPTLKVAKKTATTVLNHLTTVKPEKGNKKKKNIFEAASNLANLDIDEDRPASRNKWNVLQEAGQLPPWQMVTDAALNICAGCDLYGFASHPICSACTAARMLAQLTKKTGEQKG
jgi:ParB family chromosome partitioning protein